PAVVLSNGFWRNTFGGDPSIVGRLMVLSGNSYTIVGVLGPDFRHPQTESGALGAVDPDVFAALRVVNPIAAGFRGVHFLRTYWRLKPSVSLDQGRTEMESIDQWLAERDPSQKKEARTILMSVQERMAGPTKPALLILFGAVGLVLLIASANFANLLLARAASRHQEVVIRAALGAGRLRLMRQMLTESVLLSLFGGAAGLVVAMWGLEFLIAMKPANLPRLTGVRLDA